MTMRRVGDAPLFTGDERHPDRGGTEPLWQHRDMFLALLHRPSDCERCARLEARLAREEPRLHGDDAGVVIVHDPPEHLPERVPDELRRAFRVAPGTAHLGVSDRFGRIYGVLDAHSGDAERVLSEAWEWLDYLQSRCEECSPPLDWA